MADSDLVIRGGRVVFPDGARDTDIAVADGRIAGIATAGTITGGTRTIDASGLHVFPGVIDPHVHLQTFQNPFDINVKTETRNAAIGGTTTMIPTLLNREDATVSFLEYFPWAKAAVEEHSLIDAGFSAVIGTDKQIEELPAMAYEHGITSYKFYMAYTKDEMRVFGILAVDDAQFLAGMRQVAEIGAPAIAMVHAENMSIIHNLKEKFISEGRDDLKAWTDARPDIAEEEATRRAIWYAKETNSRLYIVHMTIGRGVEWVRQAQAEGIEVIAETCPHYLVLTKFDHEKVGSLGKVNPPLRDEESQARLWGGLRDGTVTCVGSDHSTIVPKPDKVNTSIWDAVPGFPGMGMLLPIMLSEGYHKGNLALEDVSRILGLQNAKVWGVYPRKGTIQIGSDADFAIVDLDAEREVTPEYMQSAADWGLYDGWTLKGWPTMTIVRGEVVMDGGEIVGDPSHGQYVPRYPYARKG
ncbi:MAG: dihydroorotase [Acidimicrobiales bacterium]